MATFAPPSISLTDMQFRGLLVLMAGPLTAEAAAERAAHAGLPRHASFSRRPYLWWGRIMKQMPAGSVASEWDPKAQEHRWTLTPFGLGLLRNALQTELASSANEAAQALATGTGRPPMMA